jgi:DNA/RNA-binding domain of Phe-tRNA-synthetase-like protein
MQVSLAAELRGRVIAVWFALDGLHHREDPGFRAEVARVAAALRARWAGASPASIPLLAPARQLYKATGMDPTRHRPSSEALLRRLLLGKELYRLDPVVDTGNLFSLAHGLPLGLYDRERIAGDVTLRLGQPGEHFPGIRKAPVNVGGRLCLADAAGAFGSPSSDSERTAIGETTQQGLALLYAPGDYPPAQLASEGVALVAAFARWNGASASVPLLLGV